MEICDKEGDENDKNEEGERKEAKARWYETSQTTEEVIKEKFHEEKNPIDDEALTDPEGLEGVGNTHTHTEISDEKIVSNEEITDDNAPSCNPSEPRGCCQCTREEFRNKTEDIFLTYFLLFGIVFSIGLAAGELRVEKAGRTGAYLPLGVINLTHESICRSLSSPWCGVPRSTDHCDVCGRDLYFLASRDHFEVLTTTECLQELQGESETGGNAEQQ
jgi:hypothetical protein